MSSVNRVPCCHSEEDCKCNSSQTPQLRDSDLSVEANRVVSAYDTRLSNANTPSVPLEEKGEFVVPNRQFVGGRRRMILIYCMFHGDYVPWVNRGPDNILMKLDKPSVITFEGSTLQVVRTICDRCIYGLELDSPPVHHLSPVLENMLTSEANQRINHIYWNYIMKHMLIRAANQRMEQKRLKSLLVQGLARDLHRNKFYFCFLYPFELHLRYNPDPRLSLHRVIESECDYEDPRNKD